MAEVPENQRITKILKTRLNHGFAAKAQILTPDLFSTDHDPQRLVQFETDKRQFFGIKSVTCGNIESLASSLWGKGDDFVLDFGLHMVGYLSFRLEAEGLNIDAPCRLRLVFGESPYDVAEDISKVDTWISTSWLPDEVINIDFMPEDVVLPRRYSFRYLRVHIVDTSPKYKVKFCNVVCRAVSSVSSSSNIQLYDYNDPGLALIDEISILTLRDCMQTVFEDGPRRDRRLWIGDLRLQALTSYHTIPHFDLVKRCLYMFAALPREDSSLPACLFEKPKLVPATDYIVDYDALFGVVVYDYVVASGDFDTGHDLWPTVQGSLLGALSHLNPATHVFEPSRTKAWKFLDWAPELDHAAGLHGLLLYCLKAVNSLATLLSIQQPYNNTVSDMTAAASTFLDVSTGLFVSGPESQVSLASAAWLTLSAAFPMSTSRSALLGAMKHPNVIKPLTPYLYHHIVDALASVELYTEAVDLLKSYWGGMVEAGADTFWECFDANNPRSSPYGDVHNNSFCHAWSCSPSWLLRSKSKDHLNAQVIGKITIYKLEARHIKRTCNTESVITR